MAVFAGQRLLASTFDDLTDMIPFVIKKTADQLYQSDITLRNDSELTCALKANSEYIVEAWVQAVGQVSSTGDIVLAWSVPSGATGARWTMGPAASNALSTDTNMTLVVVAHTASVQYGTTSTSTGHTVIERLRIVTTNAGTLTLQHAQAVSNANNTGARTWSHMIVQKVA